MLMSMTLALAVTLATDQTDGEKAFKAYTDLAVGGVWTTTIDGAQISNSYQRAVNNQFVRLTTKGSVDAFVSFEAMIGIDPETKKCSWWVFNEHGGVGKVVMTQEAVGVWMLEGKAIGPKGKVQIRTRLKRVDADTIEEQQIEVVVDGEKQPTRTNTWTRKR